MSFGFGALIALSLLVIPGAIVARIGRLTWPTAIAVGPALTYGTVGSAIVPFGALGAPWNAWTALLALALVCGAILGLRTVLGRFRDPDAQSHAVSRGPALLVAAGVLLGAALIGVAAIRGIPQWQSIPSTWDAVWHANTIGFILGTGQASPTHMGELRNIETHEALYYPSTFHALASVLSLLTGAAPTTACTLSSAAAAIWLFPRHPLWTHYDFPIQQGPGHHRFVFWAHADDADTDPRIAEAVKALGIRYVVTSTPVVRGFVIPDGLGSLDTSRSSEKIYDNGEARVYKWAR